MRVFLGCPIPDPIASDMAQWAREHLPSTSVRYVPPENLHVTAIFFGEVTEDQLEDMKTRVRELRWRPVRVSVMGAQMYGRNVLGLSLWGTFGEGWPDGMAELWKMRAHPKSRRDLNPHVTVARLMPGATCPATPPPPKFEFTLDRLVLYQSVLSPEGSVYTPLAEAKKDMSQGPGARIARWLAVLAWIAVIFITSSTVVTTQQLVTAVTTVSSTSAAEFESTWRSVWWVFVKGWHVTEFAILFALVYSALRRTVPAVILCLGYALFDELHQVFVASRGGRLSDVLIDALGVVLAWLIFANLELPKEDRAPVWKWVVGLVSGAALVFGLSHVPFGDLPKLRF